MKRSFTMIASVLALALASSGILNASDPGSNPPSETPPALSADSASPSMNKLILQVISQMPTGGGYSVKKDAMMAMRSAVEVLPLADGVELKIKPEAARPSYCSEATYLAFLTVIQTLISRHQLQLSSQELRMFIVGTQADGEGIWGRWNANGPGTARLFYELGIGTNFPSIDSAKPGDFLKVFWTEEIGAKEFGHSVIFLGRRMTPQGEIVRFWSSNTGVGFGEKEVPLAKMKRVVVSRFDNPGHLQGLLQLPKKDAFLASMLTERYTPELMYAKIGISSNP